MPALYLFDKTENFCSLIIDKSGNIIKSANQGVAFPLKDGRELSEIMDTESYINVSSFIERGNDFFVFELDYKIKDGGEEIYVTAVIKQSDEHYFLVLLPNEATATKLIHDIDMKIDQSKDYSEEVFHDLRGITSSLEINMNTLLRKHAIPSEDVKEYNNNFEKLSSLVDDLIFFANLEAKKPKKKKNKIQTIIENAICQTRACFDEYPDLNTALMIEWNGKTVYSGDAKKFNALDKEYTGSFYSDETLLSRALQNILENAFKYSRFDKEPKVLIAVKTSDSLDELQIKDNGIGIRKADRNKIVKRGFRSSVERVQATRGSGMGLAIAKKILTQHNLRLVFDTDANKYTCVTIRGLR